MLVNFLISSSLLVLLAACRQSELSVGAQRVYDNRDELIREFSDIDVWRRGDSAFLLHIYNDGKANRYLFRGDNGLKLQSDTTEFQLKEMERFKNIDTLTQSNVAQALLTGLLKKMDTLNIRDVSSDFSHLGINLQFRLKQAGVVFFVKDVALVTNPVWQSYIKESKTIGENWYYNEK
jgi:hypothetical protein